jgi:hypothetical protein
VTPHFDINVDVMATTRSVKEVEMGDIANMRAASASSFSVDDKTSIMKGKSPMDSTETLVRYETNDAELAGSGPVVANTEEIALKALHVDDDPTLDPWTFRMWFLGEAAHQYLRGVLTKIQVWDCRLSGLPLLQYSCSSLNPSASP